MKFKCQFKFERKHLSVIGCFLIYLVLSSLYIFGQLLVYLASYIKNEGNDHTTIEDLNIMIVFNTFVSATMVAVSEKVQKRFKEKYYALVMITLFSSTWFMSSFTTNAYLFIILYGIIGPFFSGIMYTLPLQNVSRLFAENKGKACGVIFTAFGFGPFVWNSLLFVLINPDDIQAVNEGGKHQRQIFPKEVTDRFPFTIRILSIIFVILGLFGAFCLKDSKSALQQQEEKQDQDQQQQIQQQNVGNDNNSQQKNKQQSFSESEAESDSTDISETQTTQQNNKTESEFNSTQQVVQNTQIIEESKQEQPVDYVVFPSLKKALLNKGTLQFAGLFQTAIIFGFLIAPNFKNYGIKFIESDKFFALVASISSLANGFSRLFWGFMIDKYPFKLLAIINMTVQLFLAITIQFVVTIRFLYLIYIFMIFWTYAGWWTMGPNQCFKMFGLKRGNQIYGIVYLSVIGAGMLEFLCLEIFSWNAIFIVYSVLIGVGTVMSFICSFELKSEVEELKEEPEINTTRLDEKFDVSSSDFDMQAQQNQKNREQKEIEIQEIEMQEKKVEQSLNE